jgi:hypothetical protein
VPPAVVPPPPPAVGAIAPPPLPAAQVESLAITIGQGLLQATSYYTDQTTLVDQLAKEAGPGDATRPFYTAHLINNLVSGNPAMFRKLIYHIFSGTQRIAIEQHLAGNNAPTADDFLRALVGANSATEYDTKQAERAGFEKVKRPSPISPLFATAMPTARWILRAKAAVWAKEVFGAGYGKNHNQIVTLPTTTSAASLREVAQELIDPTVLRYLYEKLEETPDEELTTIKFLQLLAVAEGKVQPAPETINTSMLADVLAKINNMQPMNSAVPSSICYNCGQTGHWMANCTTRVRPVTQQDMFSSSQIHEDRRESPQRHMQKDRGSKHSTPCRFYLKSKGCTRWDCPFAHDPSKVNNPSAPDRSRQDRPRQPRNRSRSPEQHRHKNRRHGRNK